MNSRVYSLEGDSKHFWKVRYVARKKGPRATPGELSCSGLDFLGKTTNYRKNKGTPITLFK